MRLDRALSPLVLGMVLAACSPSSTGPSSTTAPSSVSTTTTVPTTASTTSTTAAVPPTTVATASIPPATHALAASSGFGNQSSPCRYVAYAGQPALPDASCTPGSTNPAVTQDTIQSTICISGYTSSIRPPESVTYPEKLGAMAAYGQTGSTSGYEYDHLVSLEVGGAANSAADLWPEPLAGPYGAKVKDRLENKLHDLVCSGALSLVSAQQSEAADWVAAYVRYVGPLG